MKRILFLTSILLVVLMTVTMTFTNVFSFSATASAAAAAATTTTGATSATPIKHVVVIFQENVSYDHYFATYPHATNPANEPAFVPASGTPSANGLTQQLIDNNPNSAKPFRLDRVRATTCDQDHDYKDEQAAYDGGLLDKFVEKVGATGKGCDPKDVMGYYDGNTVTALWNYAQHFAMSDNSFSSTFGPSTPGALNLVAGQTHGATPENIKDEVVNGTAIGDPDGTYDDCSAGKTIAMSGKNVGDLLNENNVTWGWFQGGFKPTGHAQDTGKAVCGSFHHNIAGANVTDYSAHHEPFQYYASTANPHHLPSSSVSMIGKTDQANHQYDLSDFWSAADSGNMPAISFLKAAKYQDGHAGYSNPLDEQKFLADTINHLQILPEWKSTAVIVLYDDSDGWYDHVMPPIINQSNDPSSDALLGAEGLCGHASLGSYQDRCGYGPRQPLLVISPYAKVNYIDHQITDQSSVLRFIEENWNLGRIGNQSFDAKAGSIMNMFDFTSGAKRAPPLFLDSSTGSIIPETYYKLGNGIASGDVTYAGHIKLEGLLPDTNYYYKVWFTTVDEAGKTVADPPSYGTFKTAPDPSENKPVSFVMGGDLAGQQYCSRVDVNFPIFNAMKALGPDFFIFNGDEIYADNDCPASGPANVTGWNNIPGGFPRVNDPSVNWTNYSQVHDIYLKHWQYNRADPNLQSLLRNVSMYSQADDHEVANNWAPSTYYSNSTMSRAGFPNLIKAGIQEFFNFSPIDRNADEPDRIYRSFHWGKNVDLFIADQHQYRSRNDLPDTPANNKTLLGKEQLHWLEQGILNSNATWKIVSLDDPITIPECATSETSTTPLGCDNFAPDGKTDLTFTRERNEFLKFLDDHDIKNVIFIVTDVHFAGNIVVNQDFNGDGKKLVYYELANGPLSAGAGEPGPLDPTINAKYLYKEGSMFNFGYYKVQQQKDGKVHFISEVRGVDGTIRPGSHLDLVPRK